MQPTVIFEDNHLLIINKPHGMPSQNDETGDQSAYTWAIEYLREKYQKPGGVYVGLVHRLDRPTAGILVMTKTSKAAERLSVSFQQGKVQKVYHAVTERIPSPVEGELKHWMAKMPEKNIMKAYQKEVPGSKIARLSYHTLSTKNGKALVEVHPHTGRQHQIRVQLSAIGCPLIGDCKYGAPVFLPDKSIALIAKQITFEHPTLKTPVTFTVPYPNSPAWTDWQ